MVDQCMKQVVLWVLPVLPKEYEVTLIVEGDNIPGHKVRLMGEQGSQHACYNVPNSSCKVVQHHLRVV